MSDENVVPSLTDEQIRDIENDQAKMPGTTRDNLTIRTVRAALIAQHGFCCDANQCTCAREIGYRVCQPSPAAPAQSELDACEVCGGAKGGVAGNENLIGGRVVCDYCHADGSFAAPPAQTVQSEAVALEACRAIVKWCDENPPAGDALWCVQLARQAIAAQLVPGDQS